MAGNNFGGIKATSDWQGEVAKLATKESVNGKMVGSMEAFRQYGSMEEGIKDYVQFVLQNPRYRRSGLFEAKTPNEYFVALQRAGYATDPDYATKLAGTYKRMYSQ